MEQYLIETITELKSKISNHYVGQRETQALRLIGLLARMENEVNSMIGADVGVPTRDYNVPLFPNVTADVFVPYQNVEIEEDEDIAMSALKARIAEVKDNIRNMSNEDIKESISKPHILGLAKELEIEGLHKESRVTVGLIQKLKDRLTEIDEANSEIEAERNKLK